MPDRSPWQHQRVLRLLEIPAILGILGTQAVLGLASCPTPQPSVPVRRPPTATETYRPYHFTVEGKTLEPETKTSLNGDPEHLRPGDVIVIDGIPLQLGEERSLRLVMSTRGPDRLLYTKATGDASRLIGLKVGWTFENDQVQPGDSLSRLSPGELRGLMGLMLDAWPKGTEERLRHLDAARVCLGVSQGTAEGKERRFPRVPRDLRCLMVKESSSEGIRDFSPLVNLEHLQFLDFDRAFPDTPVDLRLLTASRGLRVLILSNQKVSHPEALARLSELRELTLSGIDELTELSFVSKMPHLMRLWLGHSGIRSLAPLQGLPSLVEVDARASRVSVLPAGSVPALRKLNLIANPITFRQVERFRAANPRCTVDFGWIETLRRVAARADRLRVRTGGTCHRRPAHERTIFELKGPAAVAALMGALDLVEEGAGFHCMCCGDPSFELYQGPRLLATLGFHHGRSLRWAGWPGDAALTKTGGDRLVAFLAKHGYKGPAEERERGKQQALAAQRRAARYKALLPSDVLVALSQANEAKDVIAALDLVMDPVKRATLVLRLFGCDEASWNLYTGLDRVISDGLLTRIDVRTWHTLLGARITDVALATGAARALFGENQHTRVGAASLAKALPVLSKTGLTHPRADVRHLTIAALGRIATPVAVQALRGVMRGASRPRPLAEEDRPQPEGMLRFAAEHASPIEDAGEVAHAAFCLAKLGDRRSFREIRRLAAKAQGADRVLMKKALDLIDAARAPCARRR